MDNRTAEPLVPGDFVRYIFSDRLFRVLSCEMVVDRIAIATVVNSLGRRRWYPIDALRRTILTADEEAQWCLDQLQQ